MAGGLPPNLMALLQNSMGGFQSGTGANPFAGLPPNQEGIIPPPITPPGGMPPTPALTPQGPTGAGANPFATPGLANMPGATAPANPMGGNAIQALLQLLAQHRGAAPQGAMPGPGAPSPMMQPRAPIAMGSQPMMPQQGFSRSPIALGNQPMQPSAGMVTGQNPMHPPGGQFMQMNGQGPALPNLPPQVYAMLAQQLQKLGQF